MSEYRAASPSSPKRVCLRSKFYSNLASFPCLGIFDSAWSSRRNCAQCLADDLAETPSTAHHSTTMSFLRSQSSLRLSRTCSQIPASTRWLSQTPQRRLGEPDPKAIPDVQAMQMTEDQASMVEIDHKPDPAVEKYHPDHQPDYTATVDHGTSLYSPIPRRVMNGSEPGEVTPAAVLSGAPVDLQARTVR